MGIDCVSLQEELVNAGYMKPPPDMALAARSAARAAKAAKRRKMDQQRLDFRRFTSPGGLEVIAVT